MKKHTPWCVKGLLMRRCLGFLLVLSAITILGGCSRSTVTVAPQQQTAPPPPTDQTPAAAPSNPPADAQSQPAAVADTTSSTVPEQNPSPSTQPAPPAENETEGDNDSGAYETFYSSLASQGEWIQTPNYGYVFQPAVRDPGWAPYSNGHWVYTDQGWTWVSNESWGWATYHYGRWANIEGTGWVWVPGRVWAPAWVSWRNGGGYCGWAPLPPETARIDVRIGVDCDVAFHIGAGCYNLLPQQYMGERDYRPHYVKRTQNFTIINRTTNITNITINKTIINNVGAPASSANFRRVTMGGPSLQEINASSRTTVARLTLSSSNQRGPAAVHGNTLAVYAPSLVKKPGSTAQPPKVARRLTEAVVNRGEDAAKPLQVTHAIKPAETNSTVSPPRLPAETTPSPQAASTPTSVQKAPTVLQPAAPSMTPSHVSAPVDNNPKPASPQAVDQANPAVKAAEPPKPVTPAETDKKVSSPALNSPEKKKKPVMTAEEQKKKAAKKEKDAADAKKKAEAEAAKSTGNKSTP
jgi:hypothetical protein